MGSSTGIQEAELRTCLKLGGQLQGLLVVARSGLDATEYAIYVRPSWTRGYRILRTWRDKDDRTFRSLDRLFKLPVSFGYHAAITIYPAGCPELQKFRGVLAKDGGRRRATAAEADGAGPQPVDSPAG